LDWYISNDMKVERWEIINELSLNWKVRFLNTQKLTFPESGKITAVYKKVWDLVKAGDIIAKMDTYEIDNELELAKIDLENEQRKLDRALDTSKTELERLQAEKKYQTLVYEEQNSEATLSLKLQTIENESINTKNAYEQAVKDYEKKLKEYNTLLETYQQVITLEKADSILSSDEVLKEKVLDLKYSADTVNKELDKLDEVMHYTDKYWTRRPVYDSYIWADDLRSRIDTEKYFNEVKKVADSVYKRANTLDVSKYSDVELKSLLIQQYEEMKNLADSKTKLSESAELMFEKSLEYEQNPWTAVTITNWRSLKSECNKAIDEILWLTTPDTIWEKRKSELEDLALELEKQKQELDKLKIAYEQIDLERQQKINDAMLDFQMKWLEVQIAHNELEDIEKGNQDTIAEIKNSIKQKQKTVETIKKKYDNYILKANFDWIITKLNLQVGDGVWNSSNTSESNEKYVYIENPDTLEIELEVDQIDIVKLQVWMEVQILLDALPGSDYTGTITEIDTTAWWEDYYWWSTTYKAKVVFQKKAEDSILGSMTATVSVILDEAHDVLVVPNIAISNEMEWSFVMKVIDWKYHKTPVEIWISDMANSEILSGIEEWDIIMWVFVNNEWMEVLWINDDSIDPRAI